MEKKYRSFAERILEAAHYLQPGGASITPTDIANMAGLQTRQSIRCMYDTLSDLVKSGRLSRVSRGVYAVPDNSSWPQPPKNQAAMWRILRARRTVTVDDLRELAGVSAGYAKEWLRTLTRHNLVRSQPDGKYQLINDPGPQPPTLTDNADKLRRLRAQKKANAIAALERAGQALAEAVQAVEKLDKEEL